MSGDTRRLAQELLEAYAHGTPIAATPTSRDPTFDLNAAYEVEAEIARLRRAAGHAPVGRKVGFANKAMWRILKLDTLVWAHMYDDTVRHAADSRADVSLAGRHAPKIEPEIVVKLRHAIEPGITDAAALLSAVEWLAIGFEINDCVFPEWQFKPADFVAALGFHTMLVVGEPAPVTPGRVTALVDELANFTLTLLKGGECVETGSGRNSLKSPALCLGELASAIARRPGVAPLAAGELVSTGTLTTPQPVAAGQEWTARLNGIALPALQVTFC